MDGIEVRRHVIGRGPVTEIVLDRPEALNALNTAMLVRLAQTCAELAPDPGVRAVVLTATGDRAFCVGADLKERQPDDRRAVAGPADGVPHRVR